jgi:two-component system NtrC family sensor kinase
VSRVEAGERYDTVLCDLGLADATGWDVAARIGAAAPGTRILLVTGWAEEIPADDPRRGFVARVLSKPLGIAELQEIMREPLAPRPAPAQPSERAEPLRADGPSPDQ